METIVSYLDTSVDGLLVPEGIIRPVHYIRNTT